MTLRKIGITETMPPSTHTGKLIKNQEEPMTPASNIWTQEPLTLRQAITIIRADGQGIEQTLSSMLWHVWFDTFPSNRHMTKNLIEAGVIEYAERILWEYQGRQQR